MGYVTTSCLRKRPTFDLLYNVVTHGSFRIIFGTDVSEKVGNQSVLYFLTSPNLCFCTTWGSRKPEIASFHLNVACFLPNTTRNTLKYHLVAAEPRFTIKTIDWKLQTGPRILLLLPTCSVLTKTVTVSVVV